MVLCDLRSGMHNRLKVLALIACWYGTSGALAWLYVFWLTWLGGWLVHYAVHMPAWVTVIALMTMMHIWS